MHTDNEEEFCDNPPLLHPDLEGPHIEMLDQSLSVSHFMGGYESTQTSSNLESTCLDQSVKDEHEAHEDHEHEEVVRSYEINWEIPHKHIIFSLVKNYGKKLPSGLEGECNVCKKCVLA